MRDLADEAGRAVAERAQALALLAEAGEAVDLELVLQLAEKQPAFAPGGGGAVDLALRLIRSGAFPEAEQKAARARLAKPLFELAKSLGGRMEVGLHTDFAPWLARLQGFDEPELLKLLQGELTKRRYHDIIATGPWGGQWGFPIYERVCQALAVMRTPAAAEVLLNHPPAWVQHPLAGFRFWYLALAESRDPRLLKHLLDTARERKHPRVFEALAALAYARDREALAFLLAELPKITEAGHRGWAVLNLAPGAGEWAPGEVAGALSAAADDPVAEIREHAISQLAQFSSAGVTGDAAFRAAAEVAASRLLECGRDARRDVRLAAARWGFLRPEWPGGWAGRFRAELRRLAAGDADAEVRVCAANGLLAPPGNLEDRGFVGECAARDAERGVRERLTRLLSRPIWAAEVEDAPAGQAKPKG